MHAGLGQRVHLLGSRALTTGNDGARVTHPPTRWSRLSRDKSNHRLPELAGDERRRFLFGRAADLANHDDGLGVRIRVEEAKSVDEARADQRISANPDTGRLPHLLLRQLMDG